MDSSRQASSACLTLSHSWSGVLCCFASKHSAHEGTRSRVPGSLKTRSSAVEFLGPLTVPFSKADVEVKRRAGNQTRGGVKAACEYTLSGERISYLLLQYARFNGKKSNGTGDLSCLSKDIFALHWFAPCFRVQRHSQVSPDSLDLVVFLLAGAGSQGGPM